MAGEPSNHVYQEPGGSTLVVRGKDGGVIKGQTAAAATPAQASAITDASTAHALNATFSDTEVEAALNALGTKLNSVLAALRGVGIVAT